MIRVIAVHLRSWWLVLRNPWRIAARCPAMTDNYLTVDTSGHYLVRRFTARPGGGYWLDHRGLPDEDLYFHWKLLRQPRRRPPFSTTRQQGISTRAQQLVRELTGGNQ